MTASASVLNETSMFQLSLLLVNFLSVVTLYGKEDTFSVVRLFALSLFLSIYLCASFRAKNI